MQWLGISLESSFVTRKLLQMLFGTLCTATLKICFEVSHFGSDSFNLLTRKLFASRVNSDILDSEIDTENILGPNRLGLRNIHYNTKIERSFEEKQIGLTPDSVHSRSMIITNQNWELDSSSESQNRNSIKTFPSLDMGFVRGDISTAKNKRGTISKSIEYEPRRKILVWIEASNDDPIQMSRNVGSY